MVDWVDCRRKKGEFEVVIDFRSQAARCAATGPGKAIFLPHVQMGLFLDTDDPLR